MVVSITISGISKPLIFNKFLRKLKTASSRRAQMIQ